MSQSTAKHFMHAPGVMRPKANVTLNLLAHLLESKQFAVQ